MRLVWITSKQMSQNDTLRQKTSESEMSWIDFSAGFMFGAAFGSLLTILWVVRGMGLK